MNSPYAQAALALAELDLTPVSAEIADAERQAQHLRTTIAETEAEIRQISEQIASRMLEQEQQRALGDRLLAGGDVMAKDVEAEALEKKKRLLTAGLRELRTRLNAIPNSRSRQREAVDLMMREAVAPIEAELDGRRDTVMEALRQLYADASALASSAGSSKAHWLARKLGDGLVQLRDDRMIRASPIDVSAPLLSALEAGRPAIELARRGIVSSVAFPSWQ